MFWWSVAIAAAAIYLQRYVYPRAVVAVADVGLYWLYYREKWSWRTSDRLAMLFCHQRSYLLCSELGCS
jgi:hypothetical protein